MTDHGYKALYGELQRRMGSGGDLSPGPQDTFSRFARGELWEPERERLHLAVLEQFKDRCQGLPRDGHAALLTAGAPGAGKGGAQANLSQWQGQDSELGRELMRVHGVDLNSYVALDPDQFKVAIFEHGGLPQLDSGQMRLPEGRQLSPSEMASLIHRESAFLQDQFEIWARGEGYNLLYDATLKNLDKNSRLLTDLQREGYEKRVVLSVEVPLEQCLAQNAARWEAGRKEFDAGRDKYGGRMAPEGMIKDLYAQSSSGRGYSIGRDNAEKLADRGLATGLITSDRGDFRQVGGNPSPPAGAQALPAQAQAFRMGDSTVRISAASRLRSVSGTATPASPAAHQPTAPPRLPNQPKNQGPHR
ncbi:zeta toxin family protein [Streptomyces capitiformicae]|uniref:UDP-N-acetylglucosamine kinase n=1 Tax=Streptomyces capitiformicae TaxID=2014920 RepID=A0A919LAV5_9ACTN|nr:zeta toxin family protein [Streptomyces capitiformicae]GHH88301.1 hypothetical protein GCM10017771_32960 [Streptomyces capitiformicae]